MFFPRFNVQRKRYVLNENYYNYSIAYNVSTLSLHWLLLLIIDKASEFQEKLSFLSDKQYQ